MSFELLRRVWELSLSAVEKLLLLALADFADDDGKAWPAVATLCRKTGLNDRTVQRTFRSLVTRGFLRVERRDGRASVYCVTIPQNPRQPDTPVTVTPRQSDTRPRHSDTPTPVTVTPRTYQLNQSPNQTLSSSPSATEPEGFAEFWKAYPRKVARPAALRAWKRQKINGELPEILAALDRFKASPKWQENRGEFIPYPASWLNGRRWEDEDAGHTSAASDNRVRLN